MSRGKKIIYTDPPPEIAEELERAVILKDGYFKEWGERQKLAVRNSGMVPYKASTNWGKRAVISHLRFLAKRFGVDFRAMKYEITDLAGNVRFASEGIQTAS